MKSSLATLFCWVGICFSLIVPMIGMTASLAQEPDQEDGLLELEREQLAVDQAIFLLKGAGSVAMVTLRYFSQKQQNFFTGTPFTMLAQCSWSP